MKSFTDYLNEKMDPRDHAVERDGKFVVVDKDGKTVKSFEDKAAAEKYAVANHDKLMEGCGCDGTNEDFEIKKAGKIGAAISNRKDLPASEKNVARRSLQRKVARAQRKTGEHNVNADAGRRYRVGTNRPVDPKDPKHAGLRRNATISSYGTNEEVEQVDELSDKTLKSYIKKAQKDNTDRVNRMADKPSHMSADKDEMRKLRKRQRGVVGAKKRMGEDVQEACWDSHVQQGTKMKKGKMVPNCVPRNEGTEEIDELKMPKKDARGNIKSRKVRGAYQAGSLRASDKDHDHMDKSFKSSGDKQIDHMNKSIAAGERSNDRFKKALKKESVEESKKKIKIKVKRHEPIGYEVRSVGPAGKTTVTKRRDMPGKENVGEASGAWQRKEGKNKEGGLNAAGRASYERENPGSDLKAPVSAEQAKKSKGGKAAKRRKSFCARMGGMKGAMKDEKGRPTRKALALRKWDC